jgi:hypothetical protein
MAAAWATGSREGGPNLPSPGEPYPALFTGLNQARSAAGSEAESSGGLEDGFSTTVLAYRGLSFLIPLREVGSEGLEFVVGAPREELERVEGITVHLPDGTAREMFPSTDLGVPLDFFGYYGSAEGLPPHGDYVFEIRLKEDNPLKIVHNYEGRPLEIPENVNVDIDKKAGEITASWDPVEGVRNYTVDLQEVLEDRSYRFVKGVGCPDPGGVDPNDLSASYWTETHCDFSDLNSVLEVGKEYGIQIAVWGDESKGYPAYGGVDGVLVFTW